MTPGASVLVVDDERDVQLLVEQWFRQEIRSGQLRFVFFDNAPEALDYLREQSRVELVLTDIRMPEMTGLELVEKIREIEAGVQVIIISAFGDMGNIRAAMNRGAFDFLTKPLNVEDLRHTLNKALRHISALRGSPGVAVQPSPSQPDLQASSGASAASLDATVLYLRLTDIALDGDIERGLGLINRAFDIVVPLIASSQGRVDAYTGQGALAVFQGEGHRERALATAQSIQRRVGQLADRAQQLGASFPRLALGLSSGCCGLGELGNQEFTSRRQAVFGPPVERAIQLGVRARAGEVLVADSDGSGQ